MLAIVSVFYPGLNYGLDFTGGIIVEAGYTRPAELDAIRSGLTDAGFESAQVQNFGSVSEVLIRLPPADAVAAGDPEAVTAMQDRVLDVLRAQDQDVTIRRLESVGSQVGADLFENAGLALLFALILVFVYVMVRFRWKLAVGAIVATRARRARDDRHLRARRLARSTSRCSARSWPCSATRSTTRSSSTTESATTSA